MFRVEFYVDDKRLGEAMVALTGLARGQPVITPVINAKQATNGKIVAAGRGDPSDLFLKYAKQHKLEKPVAEDFRKFAKSIGRSPSGYSHLIDQLIDHQVIKKSGKAPRLTYTVLEPKHA
jgi:hypothetical protein